MNNVIRIGGSFAPPLTDELLAQYDALASTAGDEVKEAIATLHACVGKWWNLPDSTGPGVAHLSGRGVMIPLDEGIAKELYDSIPWDKDLASIQSLFDELPSGSLRDAAFHLLWHVRELNLDREPITLDKLSL